MFGRCYSPACQSYTPTLPAIRMPFWSSYKSHEPDAYPPYIPCPLVPSAAQNSSDSLDPACQELTSQELTSPWPRACSVREQRPTPFIAPAVLPHSQTSLLR